MANLVYLPIVLMGYLLGTSNMAVYLAALKGDDLRAHGSGNPGASNAMLLWGWKAGVIVGIHDIGKAVLAVYLAERLFPDVAFAGVAAGVACVIGHMFPFYLRFHGGKGFASYLGMTLALNWKFALGLCIAILVITLVTDYIVLGTMTTVISFPAYCALTHNIIMALILCIASGIIIYKHRGNLVRIYRGTEIGLRSANRGDHRIQKK
ncbi:MAG: glycerol-3-phosphate acyltransferase [Oscillospiraceae bacterium]|nr:glycerol-3-phosphate acyltransferase [Oscillospiraceae bacterium]